MAEPKLHSLHQEFPDLPAKALEFFSPANFLKEKGKLPTRTIMDFAYFISKPGDQPNQKVFPKWHRLNMICARLADFNMLMVIDKGTWDSHDARYVCVLTDEQREGIKSNLNYIVYGFPVILEDFKNSIIPIQYINDGGVVSIGTSFVFGDNAILTAAHCVKGATSLAIKSVSKENLLGAKVFISTNETLDLCLIAFKDKIFSALKKLEIGTGEILEEVLVIGYPNVPTFTEVLAAEKATISSEISVISGHVASKATEIFAKAPLFLISARVRGGFSGGPVINDKGLVVGLVSRQPISGETEAKGVFTQYDNLGYGVAIPHDKILEFVNSIKLEKNDDIAQEINVSSIDFKDFE